MEEPNSACNSRTPIVDALRVKHAAPRASVAPRWIGNETVIRVVASLAVLWGGVYLGWRVLDTWERTQPALFLLLFACEVFGWLMLASFCFLSWRIPKSTRPQIGQPHSVDVVVCTYNEGVDVLEATLLGCARIAYPHVTWVLDDGEQTWSGSWHIDSALAMSPGPTTVTPKPGTSITPCVSSTASWFSYSMPTMCLSPTSSMRRWDTSTIPRWRSYRHRTTSAIRIRFSTSPPGSTTRGMFFEVILPGKDRHNGVFWCGSAAVIRRVALLEVGGVATQTIAEDFHTTIKLHGRGWKTRYHDETLVQGLAPHDLSSYLLQRDRWARGNLAVFKTAENPLVARHLSLPQRVSYLSSLMAYFVPIQRLGLLAVLTIMLVSGQLPMHATLSGFLTFWLPWIALDMAASAFLCRGRASLWDGTYSMLLTMEIFALAALSLLGPASSTFKVTPKDGIDDGGWRALSQLRLVMGIAVVLTAAVALRGLTAAGLVPLPHLAAAPLVIGMALGLWELGLTATALAKVGERRQLRRHYRAPGSLAGVVGDRIVRVVDPTTGGVGLVSPVPIERGAHAELHLELPLVDGRIQSTHLRLTVTECRPDPAASGRWRIGGTVTPLANSDRTALVEYCHVVATRAWLLSSGRLRTGTSAAPGVLPFARP